MVSLDYFRQLFDYDCWANHQAVQSLESAWGDTEHGRRLLGHIIGAQRVWLERFEQPPVRVAEPWPHLTLAESAQAVDDLHERWTGLLGKMSSEQMAEDFCYQNSKGVESRIPIGELLTHLMMHSAYHRGQVAVAVRAADGQPSATDYVIYVRKMRAENQPQP